MFKVFLAGSKRNETSIRALAADLRAAGFAVYDDWLDDPSYGFLNLDAFTCERMTEARCLLDQIDRDLQAMGTSDVFVLALPCGNDAHTEMGVALAMGLPVLVVTDGEFRLCQYYNTAQVISSASLVPVVSMLRDRATI